MPGRGLSHRQAAQQRPKVRSYRRAQLFRRHDAAAKEPVDGLGLCQASLRLVEIEQHRSAWLVPSDTDAQESIVGEREEVVAHEPVQSKRGLQVTEGICHPRETEGEGAQVAVLDDDGFRLAALRRLAAL